LTSNYKSTVENVDWFKSYEVSTKKVKIVK